MAKRLSAAGTLTLSALASMGLAATTPGSANDAKQVAYGRHLAGECTSCHRIDGVDNGIPSLAGWSQDTFLMTLKFYRDGSRTNPVMVSVASSLSDEQMRALAAYFESVPKPAAKTQGPAGKKPAR